MGWNSWNHFGCDKDQLTQELFMEMAQAMVSSGMKAAGYEYINIDDCWLASTRDANGNLQPDPKRFPDGIAALSKYVHSLGLKFGIYEDSGNTTCGGYEGSWGHYEQDAKTFASWGVDFIKLDGCNTNVTDMKYLYTEFGKAINATGRPMVYSCSWPAYANIVAHVPVPYEYVASICNLWREYRDIQDNFDEWTNILDFQESANLAPYAAPGQWNDPDMLEVGNGNQTDDEYRALMSLWAILAAPLIAGNDLRNMTAETLQILTAPEIISVDQDPTGHQGSRVAKNGDLEVWARSLYDGSIAVVLFNRGPTAAWISADFDSIGYGVSNTALVRDLWARVDLGKFTYGYSTNVPSHAVKMVKVSIPLDEL